jgi:hypothetical protein
MPVSTKDLWAQSKGDATAEEAILAQQSGHVGGTPHPSDSDYQVPVTSVPLPSKGAVYPPQSPLYLCEHVDIKAMTAKEEDILSSIALIKKGVVLTTLMKSCITNRTIDPDQMLVGDRNAVLIAIRVAAYGAEYPATISCAECGEGYDHTFDMSRLPVKALTEEPIGGPGTNAFVFELPVSKRKVVFKLMDVAASQRLEKDAEGVRKKGGQEAGVTMRLRAQVLQIEGVDPKDLPRAINNMPARDSRALRKHMDDMAPGVDMVQEVECPACGTTKEVDVPLGPQFFWPSGA